MPPFPDKPSERRPRRQRAAAGLLAVLVVLISLGARPRASAAQTPQPTPTATPPGMPRPGGDRLAEPTLPADPLPADFGAQGYWLHCMPCHGDRGQGLTDDFRAQYPPEEQDCWLSGCHGERPYEDGFTLPRTIPPVFGAAALARFPDSRTLYGFVSQAMPWHAPGSLDDPAYRQIVAFLIRQSGGRLAESDLTPPAPAATPTSSAPQVPPAAQAGGDPNLNSTWGVVLLLVAGGLLAAAGLLGRAARPHGGSTGPS